MRPGYIETLGYFSDHIGTWLTGKSWNSTVSQILNTLKDYGFYDVSRVSRTGGGVRVFLRRGLTTRKVESVPFSSMENLDLDISHGNSTLRLVSICRPPRSKKNCSTTATFSKSSPLPETLTTASGHLLLNGDFNFHMDVNTDADANNFKDLLESAGLAQHVKGPSYRSTHTLDLIIDRQNDIALSSFTTLMDLPSDHHTVLSSMAFAKSADSKSQFKQRCLKDVDLDALKADIVNAPLGGKL